MNIKHKHHRGKSSTASRQQYIIAALALLAIVSLAVFKKSHQLEVPVDPTEMYTFARMSAVAYAEVPSGCKGVTRFIAKSTSGEAVSINHGCLSFHRNQR